MAVVALLLVVSSIALVVWWRRSRQSPTPPAGLLATLVDQGRDLLAPLYPSKPLSRRALPRRLLRAAEQTITIGVSGMVLVPTRIRIAVNPQDLEPFTDAMEWLRRDVAEALRQRATANGWIVPDGPEVVIVPDEQRPVRLPRAVGRIDAFRPDDVRTRRHTVPPFGGSEVRGAGRGPVPEPQPPPGQRTPTPSPPPAAAPSPQPSPSPEPTPMTSVVVGPEGTVEEHPDELDLPTVAEEPTVHLRLVAVAERTGEGSGDRNVLLVGGAGPFIVGRSREADLRVHDRQVSARHCALSIDPERRSVVVQDLGSTNGTYVDGQRVDQATLEAGTTLGLGGSAWRVELDPVTG